MKLSILIVEVKLNCKMFWIQQLLKFGNFRNFQIRILWKCCNLCSLDQWIEINYIKFLCSSSCWSWREIYESFSGKLERWKLLISKVFHQTIKKFPGFEHHQLLTFHFRHSSSVEFYAREQTSSMLSVILMILQMKWKVWENFPH